MKKLLRSVGSIVLLASLMVGHLPEAGHCQMAFSGIMAAACRMPCCQTKVPISKCPMLKTETPKDFIATTGPVLKVALQSLHALEAMVVPEVRSWTKFVSNMPQAVEQLFIGPSQPVRAPPSSIVLQAA